MNAPQPVETRTATPLDTLLLVLAVATLAGSIAAFYYFAGQINVTVRALMVLGGLVAGAAIAYQTATGKNTLGYMRGSSLELRKTTWPTKAESIQATLMIAAVVLVFAVMVWLFDSGLLYMVKQVTERG
ncbi:MAG: preprotein translocase subunit SecE [Gammaproteobacteria bacterium]